VARGSAHDHHHDTRLRHAGGRHGDVGVHVRHSDGDPGSQPGGMCHLGGQAAGAGTEGKNGARHLLIDDVPHAGIERREKVAGWEPFPSGPDGLVTRGAGVARLDAGEAPDNPVGRLDEAVRSRIDLRRLIENLQRFWEEPLGRYLPAVPRQPALTARAGDGVHPIGLGLCGVVFPQLDPGVRVVPPLVQCTERGAVELGGQHGAGGKVYAEADDVLRIHTRLSERARHCVLDRADIVGRVLQRPVRLEPNVRARQPLIDHTVCVRVYRRGQFVTVRHVDQHRASRLGAKVNADRVLAHDSSPSARACRQADRK